jgi:hypothetical protein
MAINITQFAPPSRVSSLVWDKNMEPPAGKVFEGDLVGDVTGDVTGDLTGVVRGSLLGYLSRNGVVSASSGRLIIPASSSVGNVPTNVNIDWNVSYAIVGNTQKCYIADPCNIPVVLSALLSGTSPDIPSYAKSFTSDNVLIDSISTSGNLNIYGASYIVLNGGTCKDNDDIVYDRTMSVADAYIDAGTSLILGDDTPPDGPKVSKLVWDADMVPAVGKKFKGALEGNVTGNVNGKTIHEWTITPHPSSNNFIRFPGNSTSQLYQVSPGDSITGTIECYITDLTPDINLQLLCISSEWNGLLQVPITYTPLTYTIPPGTNGIYILNNSTSYARISMKKFIIT